MSAVALAPLLLLLIGVMAWACADSQGRRAGAVIFALTTAIMLLVALGMFLAGHPAWPTVLAVTAVLDALLAVVSVAMAQLERRRTRRGSTP